MGENGLGQFQPEHSRAMLNGLSATEIYLKIATHVLHHVFSSSVRSAPVEGAILFERAGRPLSRLPFVFQHPVASPALISLFPDLIFKYLYVT